MPVAAISSMILLRGSAIQAIAAPGPLLAPVRSVLSGDDVVGQRRSGAICTPAGKLLWRDLAADGADLAAQASRALEDAGIAVGATDPEALAARSPPAVPQIVATIEHLVMRSCTPWHGLKLAAAMRASGRIVVTWRMYGAEGGRPLVKVTSCRSFRVDDAPTLRAAFARVFAESAMAAVPAVLASNGDSTGLAPAATCAPGESPDR